MEKLQDKLNYRFRNEELLRTALTHSSYANENRRSCVSSNERLEFLGDSILGMEVAEYLYRTLPDLPEGQMTKMRAELVCEQSLVHASKDLNLGSYLRLGRGEEQGGGRNRPSILADAFEAVLAAVYLDSGRQPVSKIIHTFLLDALNTANAAASKDYKTALQELVQKKGSQSLVYRLTGESGPDHQKEFTVEVCLNDAPLGTGSGKSKKEAEQNAAKSALEAMEA